MSLADYLPRLRDTVPDELRRLPVWLLWREVAGKPGDKPRKVPLYASGANRSGALDSPEDRAQLREAHEETSRVERELDKQAHRYAVCDHFEAAA